MKRLLAMIEAKQNRIKEIDTKIEAAKEVQEVTALTKEYRALEQEIADLRSTVDELEKTEKRESNEDDEALEARQQTNPVGGLQMLGTYGINVMNNDEREARKKYEEKIEIRGKELKEKRSVEFDINEMPELRVVTIGSGDLVVETKYSNQIKGTFNQVSTLIDLVNPVPLMGGNAYETAFEITTPEGGYTTETGEYTEAETQFGYVSIPKAKITAYAELSDEVLKLPNAQFQERVRAGIGKSIRKIISRQILIGAAATNSINGIFNAPANVIPPASDITITEIDADTLDTIVYNFGGEEDVESNGYLVLSKKDLSEFAAVRTADGEKLYKIELNGNTGTISSDGAFKVPFIINSACPALSNVATAAGTYCMTYGMLSGYEMPIFSPLTVEESRDFRFKTGQIAYRGSIWAGGNVAMYKGFVRIKKG